MLDDPSPLVRGMAVWALARLLEQPHFEQLKAARYPREADAGVRAEWCAGAGDDAASSTGAAQQ